MFEEKEVVDTSCEGHVIFVDRLVDFPIQNEKEENDSSQEEKNS